MRIIVLAALMLMGAAPDPSPVQGLYFSPDHESVKRIVQSRSSTAADFARAVKRLDRLKDLYASRSGASGPEVGAILLDRGEAEIEQAKLVASPQKETLLQAGLRDLDAGDPLVQPLETQYWQATRSRSRAKSAAARAYAALGDKDAEIRALQDAFSLENRRFGDQPDLYAILKIIARLEPPGPLKLQFAEQALKFAKLETEPDKAQKIEEATQALAAARALMNVPAYDAVRASAEALVARNKSAAAYQALVKGLALVKTPDQRRLYTARIKPRIFFIYDDPSAPSVITLDQGGKALSAYDIVATRFLVDQGLQPYVEEGRNKLLTLLATLRATFDSGDVDAARYFCRLMPPNYARYDNPSFPAACDATPAWGNWYASMGQIQDAQKIIQLGARLNEATPRAQPSAAMKAAGFSARVAYADLEARYGSPDAFLVDFEQLGDDAGVTRGTLALGFYAALLRDDPGQMRTILQRAGSYAALRQTEGEFAYNPLTEKLFLAGPRTAAVLCTRTDETLAAVVRLVQCERAGLPQSQASFKPPRNEDWKGLDALHIAAGPELLRIAAGTKPDAFPSALRPGTIALVPEAKLNKRAKTAIARGLSPDAAGWFDPNVRYDLHGAVIAHVLAQKGNLAMARRWADAVGTDDAAFNGGGTLMSAFLYEGFVTHQAQEGWIWLASGHPILAEEAFGSDADWAQKAVNTGEATAFDWTATIRALHGRILARIALKDSDGARADARQLVNFVQLALGRQSFSRFETRDVVVRFARPALAVAVRALVGPQGVLERQSSPEDFDAAFMAMQLMRPSTTGATVTKLAARLAASSPVLAELARQREDLRLRWEDARAARAREASDANLARLKATGAQLAALDLRLVRDFPEYVDLAGTTATPFAETSTALRPDATLLAYAFAGEEAYAVVLSSNAQGRIVRIAAPVEVVRKTVLSLRDSLEPRGGQYLRFRDADAQSLFRLVLAPVWDVAAGPSIHTIHVVSDGPLDALPFAVLQLPDASPTFVVDKVATERAPSVSAFVLLARTKPGQLGAKPFLGFGDPVLSGPPGGQRGVEAATLYGAEQTRLDVDRLRALPRLPETAEEIRRMSALLGGAPEGIVLGAEATKPHLRAMPLGAYRVVAFATHGLIAGDISGVAEPGLVLTPPAIPTANDNGFLSASEVATLDFHADLIILSACNTGAAAGEGGDGLSGLAKSFFFAGGRTLLVSHWSVESSAALDLTTTMIKLKAANPSESYPEALRGAILAMKAGTEVGAGHPGVWGPLEIVGN